MSVTCVDIPNTDEVKKALLSKIPSLVRVRYVGERKVPHIDPSKLAATVLPVYYKKFANEIESMEVLDDDVWVISFPKCGTTWVQEMVWLLQNKLDYEKAKSIRMSQRFGFIELSAIMNDFKHISDKTTLELIRAMPRPRFIKTHMHAALLPAQFWSIKPKMVYVARNPKDAAISYYHHYVNLQHYKGTMEDFLDAFLNGYVNWSPYREHLVEYWKLRNEPNILFLTYEEMSKNLMLVIRKTAGFLGATYSDDQLNELAKHLSFNEMRNNKAVNYEDLVQAEEKQFGEVRTNPDYTFIRRGKVNSYKDEMPIEYQEKFDAWWLEAAEGCDIEFDAS